MLHTTKIQKAKNLIQIVFRVCKIGKVVLTTEKGELNV